VDGSAVSPSFQNSPIFADVSFYADGLSGGFWLFLNKGRWTSSNRKIFLTGVNISVLIIGIVIVSVLSCFRATI